MDGDYERTGFDGLAYLHWDTTFLENTIEVQMQTFRSPMLRNSGLYLPFQGLPLGVGETKTSLVAQTLLT